VSLRQTWVWEFDAPRTRLWRYLADTDWVNEHAGLPRIAARYEVQPEGGTRRFASFRKGPVLFEWEERPTVWEVPHFFEVERLYTSGPLKRFFTRTTLEALDAGRTKVVVDVELSAASPLTEPLLGLIAAQGKHGATRAFRLAARLASKDDAAPPAGGNLGPFVQLADARIDASVVASIASFVEAAENRELQRMRPYELADRWGLPRREMLRAFLTATRLGLFNLSWSVICPGCRGPTPGIESLGKLERGYHCEACNLSFDAGFDRSVEVTFDARPLGRAVEQGLFCIASPQRSEHVYAQHVIEPDGAFDLKVNLPQGTYDVNAIGAGKAPFVATGEEPSRTLFVEVHPLTGIDAAHAVAAGEVRITVANECERELVVRIENGRWPDTIATAAAVTAMQEFRDLFSSDVLAPGLDLSIESLAILFTDLIGSTAMYARTGDAPAFRIVSDHFDVVRDIVARHEGVLVKTIGDAVMAAFIDPAKCLEAALELDGSVRTISADGEELRLRVGFHTGPCIAMRANDRIDYFGTTVNLAARLQSLARAGEVTFVRSLAQRPAVGARLRELGLRVAIETLPIKGFTEPVEVARVFTV
jgi:class 3 adenylate cyclase